MTSLIRRLLAASAVVVALSMTLAGMAGATTIVLPGFDLFQTETPGSSFDFDTVPNPQTVNFQGNQLGCFDFGDGNGCVGVLARPGGKLGGGPEVGVVCCEFAQELEPAGFPSVRAADRQELFRGGRVLLAAGIEEQSLRGRLEG